MSASPRKKGPAVPFDFFPTPPWCVHRLLDRHGEELGLFGGVSILEPTIGDGAIVRAVAEWVDGWDARITDALRWTGVELRRGALAPGTVLDAHFEGQDFRTFDPWELGLLGHTAKHGPTPDYLDVAFDRFDLALGNPPFSIAEAIIRGCLETSRAVAMLLRMDYLGSAARVPFWRTAASDPWLRILPEHISFDGDGTDSSTYAWFLWNVELSGPRVDVLEATPASIRSAQKPISPTGIPQLGLDI